MYQEPRDACTGRGPGLEQLRPTVQAGLAQQRTALGAPRAPHLQTSHCGVGLAEVVGDGCVRESCLGIRTLGSSRDAMAQGPPTGLEPPLGHCGERPSRNQICLLRSEVGDIHPGPAWHSSASRRLPSIRAGEPVAPAVSSGFVSRVGTWSGPQMLLNSSHVPPLASPGHLLVSGRISGRRDPPSGHGGLHGPVTPGCALALRVSQALGARDPEGPESQSPV
ncbi:hypothetical protein E5288_WYG012060 [Bos mutus]|uniref:Uncharacterized protein n=1 Tax=Bos mutus TaxID=72004 RepID=A0A6B0R8H0_9CETA|nr:hypothetical protein [Bos mutus]